MPNHKADGTDTRPAAADTYIPNERDLTASKRLSEKPVIKRRSTTALLSLIRAQRNRITRQGYLVAVLQEGIDSERESGGNGNALQLYESKLVEVKAGLADLESRLRDLLTELK